ncbi:hypothetical protein HYPSUDRAFT_72423 [Hypholoma sublateritium FD-334 SS-4]|uniref:G-protein coupled receptors family 1 profile domain-containing protein n=1 Tax=Hypholoma sublateritium (strain FD-334 SS-4) TaxID=945553 RepID=A0A0D2KJ89_HYPSF|nr:hypothetical protein HYPSUDRAFT_72423 [Hypholoma sublateritium FD-334 SS-4]
MIVNPTWRPDEDSTTIANERAWLAGMVLTAATYGIVFSLSILSFKQLCNTMNKTNFKQRLTFLVLIFVMFLLASLIVGASAKMTELSFVDARLFPGGPAAFEELEITMLPAEIVSVAYVLASLISDGIMVWRIMVIYKSCRYPVWLVMVFPVLSYLGSISEDTPYSLSIHTDASSIKPFNLGAPFYWLSLTSKLVISAFINARFWYLRRRITSALGARYGRQYLGVTVICVESALIYSAASLCFLVPYALNRPIQHTFVHMLGEVQIIAPLLIMYRIASGEAWTPTTSTDLLGTNICSRAGNNNLETKEFYSLRNLHFSWSNIQ